MQGRYAYRFGRPGRAGRGIDPEGMFLPGVRLPISRAERLLEEMPDYVLLLAWNLKDEIVHEQSPYLRGGRQVHRADPEPRRTRQGEPRRGVERLRVRHDMTTAPRAHAGRSGPYRKDLWAVLPVRLPEQDREKDHQRQAHKHEWENPTGRCREPERARDARRLGRFGDRLCRFRC